MNRWVQSICYGAMRRILTPAVRFYFRRLDPVDLEHLPAGGLVLVVANHPSSLTDVLILGVLLPRRLRFVGWSGLFRTRFHAWFLEACGALPIVRREAPPLRIVPVRLTFARRGAFRSDVTLSIGEEIALEPLAAEPESPPRLVLRARPRRVAALRARRRRLLAVVRAMAWAESRRRRPA